MLGIVALAVGLVVLIVAGIASQTSDLSGHLQSAQTTIQGWLQDLGIGAESAAARPRTPAARRRRSSALLGGLAAGVKALSSLAFFLALTALSLFFLLKDGPVIRAWGERHFGVPAPVARIITSRVLQSLRGYFLGVTTSPRSTRSWSAGARSPWACRRSGPSRSSRSSAPTSRTSGRGGRRVRGADLARRRRDRRGDRDDHHPAARQRAAPAARPAGRLRGAFGIHPLAVLVVTIAGGALFGAAGLILAAPSVRRQPDHRGPAWRARGGGARRASGGRRRSPGPAG